MKLDRLGLAVGDRILGDFKLDKISDSVGEKMIKALMMQRAGLSPDDVVMLVHKQAELEKLSRQEILNRIAMTEGFLSSAADDDTVSDSKELYKVWDEVKVTEEGEAGLRSGRIAVLGLILETVNVSHLVCGALSGKPDKELVAKLINAGLSVVSSVITIVMAPSQSLLAQSSKVLRWKFAGGILGTASAFISASVDYRKFQSAYKSDQYNSAVAMLGIKTGVEGLTGVAILLDSISSVAPLLKTIASRYGAKVVVAIIDAVAERLMGEMILRIVSILTPGSVL